MKDQRQESSNPIDGIIEEERRLALQVIPEKLLQSRLKKILEKESSKILYSFRRRVKVIITAAGMASFILAGVVILILLQKTKYEKSTVSSVTQLLEKSPGIKNLIQMNIERSHILPSEPKLSETELKSLRKTIQDFRAAGPSPSLRRCDPVFLRNPPHYDYSQKIELLFREKVIHRVMYKYLQEKKEEKNG